ncbi:MAG: hypothetical protein GYA17_11455 [Chloroflexi bacterium]|nr:hypothetical protein [Chloroflexota bacterium]
MTYSPNAEVTSEDEWDEEEELEEWDEIDEEDDDEEDIWLDGEGEEY